MGNPGHGLGHGVDDAQMGRIVVVGTIIGIPLVFVVSTLLALRVGVVNAMAIAVLPTLFSGSFVGGLILLTGALRRAEQRHADRSVVIGSRKVPDVATRFDEPTGDDRLRKGESPCSMQL